MFSTNTFIVSPKTIIPTEVNIENSERKRIDALRTKDIVNYKPSINRGRNLLSISIATNCTSCGK